MTAIVLSPSLTSVAVPAWLDGDERHRRGVHHRRAKLRARQPDPTDVEEGEHDRRHRLAGDQARGEQNPAVLGALAGRGVLGGATADHRLHRRLEQPADEDAAVA